MKSFTNLFTYFWLIILIVISSQTMNAQRYGTFEELIGPKQRTTSFYVPHLQNQNEKYKVIIGLHPYATPPQAMRDMLMTSAEKYNTILACPDGHPDNYDGSYIQPLLDYLNENYNIDNSNIVMTGYSAGGSTTFYYGCANYSQFRGLIGIAPSVSVNQSMKTALSKLPIGMIIGTSDGLYANALAIKSTVEEVGGSILFIEKPGVGHTGQYFWSTEFTSDWNDCYDFIQEWMPKPEKVELSIPENNAKDIEIQTQLKWNETEGATSYIIEISESDEFKSVFETKEQTGLSYQTRQLKKQKTYYWRVKGKNSGGEGEWSDVWMFKSFPNPLTKKPSLISPENNATNVPLAVELRFAHLDGAEEYLITIKNEESIEIYNNYIYVDIPKDSYQSDFTAYPNQTYFWKVEAKNAAGSVLSDEWKFTTIGLPEKEVNLLLPEDNAISQPINLTISWEATDDADYYHLQIFEYGQGQPEIDITDITSGSSLVTQNVELEENTKYQWRVCGVNSGGQGPFTEFRTFSTLDPTSVIWNSNIEEMNVFPNPAQNRIHISLNVTLPEQFEISITNQLGIVVKEFKQVLNSGDNLINLDINNRPSGLYNIIINSERGTKYAKFIKIDL